MEAKNPNPNSSKKDNVGMHERASEMDRLVSQINSLTDFMKQEAEQIKEMYNEFLERVKELRRSGGSEEDVKKVVDDFKAKVSAFERNDEKHRVQMHGLIDASQAKLKEITSIMEAEKSCSDKVEANPEGFLENEENQAMMQMDDPKILKKLKGDHEPASSHHEGPSEDVSKKWKADADSFDKEDDLRGVEALKQEKYKTLVGEIVKVEGMVERLKLVEQSNVIESPQKEMDQSESLGGTKEVESADQFQSLGATKEKDQSVDQFESLGETKEKDLSEDQPESLGATKIEERKG